MKAFWFFICVIIITSCTNHKYEELVDADGIFSSLQNDEFVTIERRSFDNKLRLKDLVFREGSIVEVSGGTSLNGLELAALDSFIKSVNNRTPSNHCTTYGALTVLKTFADGSVRRYRGAFDGCDFDEQSILLNVFKDSDYYR